MKKIALSLVLAVSLFAFESKEDKMDNWRSGFITAYKAMEVDTQHQGLESKKIDTKRYIIYFDANGDEIAIWDKLMVQMFGYSASIHKPVRTTNGWIIFTSYDDKATALQEFDILNEKIFKNSKRYKLEFFDNEKGEVFHNDTALLTSQLADLRELMEIASKQKLKEKEKELEANQKVALIYVDKDSKEIIEPKKEVVAPFVEPIVRTTVIDSSPKKAATAVERVAVKNTVYNEESEGAKKAEFAPHDGFVKQKKDDIIFFSSTVFDAKHKVKTGVKGEIVAVESKNGLGWYKVKGEDLYIAAHLCVAASKSDFDKFQKNGTAEKSESEKVVKTKVKVETKMRTEVVSQPQVEVAIGSFSITTDSVVLYKLKSGFNLGKSKYPSADFDFEKVMDNDYKKIEYSALVEDSNGGKYVKLVGQNLFVPDSNIFLMD